MVRRVLLVALSLAGLAAFAPGIANATYSPEDGTRFYTDQAPIQLTTTITGHGVYSSAQQIVVTKPDGTTLEGQIQGCPPIIHCTASVSLHAPLAPGTYTWVGNAEWTGSSGWRIGLASSGTRTFTVEERPTPPTPAPTPSPPPPSPPTTPPPATQAPFAPLPPGPTGTAGYGTPGAIVQSVTASSVTLSMTRAPSDAGRNPLPNFYVFNENGSGLSTFGPTHIFGRLGCATSYTFGVEVGDAHGNRSARTMVSATTAPCGTPTLPPSEPTFPVSPAPTTFAIPKKAFAWASHGRVGKTATIRVATEVNSDYVNWVVTIKGPRGVVGTIKAPVATPGLIQRLSWKVPRTLKPQTLRFCTVAYGPNAARRSSEACGRLIVTKTQSRAVAVKRPVGSHHTS
jgi:hypothetical protein